MTTFTSLSPEMKATYALPAELTGEARERAEGMVAEMLEERYRYDVDAARRRADDVQSAVEEAARRIPQGQYSERAKKVWAAAELIRQAKQLLNDAKTSEEYLRSREGK